MRDDTSLSFDQRTGGFVMVTDGFGELTDYFRDELIGSHASLLRPEALNARFDELQEALDAGSSLETIEMEIELADGGTRPIEARYASYSYEGVEGRVGVWRDITIESNREIEPSGS